jgi:uncharacterized protein involved in response to NO
MLIQLDAPCVPESQPVPVLRAGFRPFFLLAGLHAAIMVPVWLVLWFGGHSLALVYPTMLWHGHEMVFGYGSAAVAGFLLTAVPNWTGAPPLSGRPLAALAGLWLAGRLAFALGGLLPPGVAASLSLLFAPLLGLALAAPLIAAKKPRNLVFLLLLALFTAADGLVLAEMTGWGDWGRNGLFAGIFLLLTMIAIVGGRVIPGFTVNGLRQKGITVVPRSHPLLDKAGALSVALTGMAWTVAPDGTAAGTLALVAALLNAARLWGWHGHRTAGIPLLWVLHLGFAWLPTGLALLGASCFLPAVSAQDALHGLTTGCIGLMTLGVMSRAALGHSGRPLTPTAATVAAFALVALAALIRTIGPWLDDHLALSVSALCWSLGFVLYTVTYLPICLRARADGRPG